MNENTITWQEIRKSNPEDYVYVDVRGKVAYDHGHIPKAVCLDEQEGTLEQLPEDKKLILYCTYGEKSQKFVERLRNMGRDAWNLSGGYRQWLFHNFSQLSKEELERYDRQIILPQVGSEGQTRLKNARVLIVGAGGLGAPAALYLAGAGVGTIGIVDADKVSIHNLQRQIIHTMDRENMNKAQSAKHTIEGLNDHVTVNTYEEYLTPQNVERILKDYDFVIDAVDNFETKFLINDACVLAKKGFCHGGILQFQGQVMTYEPGESPCYRCIFEEIPQEGSVPNCSQAGVIGAVAGIIGCIQALEAIKYILQIGKLLTGRMYVLDGLTMEGRIVKFPHKNPHCRVCGEHGNIKDVKENQKEYMQKGCLIP